jgi:formylglycine-generating enzyme required for sulfatase activity
MDDVPTPPPILDDLPTGRDALDFAPYVDALAEILLDPATRTPLTLGIFGSWGSGKTSLMTMLRHRVARSDEATATPTHRTVWFNAWKYHHESALWRALLLVLLDDLARLLDSDPPADREAAKVRLAHLRRALYQDVAWTEKGAVRPDWTQALTAGAGLAFNLILSGVGLGLAKEVVETAREALGEGAPVSRLSELAQAFKREELSHTQAQLRSLEQFQRNFAELVALLLGEQQRRLVVFVDDLDRCVPERAIQVLEAIKLFLDVRGCVFVLGLDDEAVEAAVRTRYRGEVKAREYLEKIVQLPFILPPIEDDAMLHYVESLAPALPDPRCAQVFAQGLRPNPRQVKRTLNIYLLLSRLVDKRADLRRAITPVRLAKLVAIQHAHPEFYDLLRLSPRYLPELARHLRRARDPRAPEEEAAGPALPEALVPFAAEPGLRRLLGLFEAEDARFDGLKPLEVRSYITLTKRSTPLEAPAVASARRPFEPEVVSVPAGPFWMGTSDAHIAALRERHAWAEAFDFGPEQPQHQLTLPAFEIGRYPVTNAEYAAFVEATGHAAPRHWRGGAFPDEMADHPVVYVSWHDAQAYVAWLRERTEVPYRLPTEAEWEKAARGPEARLWPWGDTWAADRCTMGEAAHGTTPVGQHSPAGDSPCGAADMAGNVWEWCNSRYEPYPYRPDDGRENLDVEEVRVLRGGCWRNDNPATVRCACRDWIIPYGRNDGRGFRVARGSSESTLSPGS